MKLCGTLAHGCFRALVVDLDAKFAAANQTSNDQPESLSGTSDQRAATCFGAASGTISENPRNRQLAPETPSSIFSLRLIKLSSNQVVLSRNCAFRQFCNHSISKDASPGLAWNSAASPTPGTHTTFLPQNTTGVRSRNHGATPASWYSLLKLR